MRYEPEHSGCSIVLLGQFNPAIFQPAWLKELTIEPGASADQIDLKLIHRDLASFSIENTRSYHVEKERFQLETASGPWVKISDICNQIFGEHLIHTPLRAFGINRSVHFRLPTSEARMALGRKLAPIDPWGDFGSSLENDDPELEGGLQSLVMRRISKLDEASVQTNVTIEPSGRIADGRGVFMQINAHYSLTEEEDTQGASKVMELLVTHFEQSIDEAESIITSIMEGHDK